MTGIAADINIDPRSEQLSVMFVIIAMHLKGIPITLM
jgi:hypothetical protein